MSSGNAEMVYFVKVNEEEDLYYAGHYIQSRFSENDQVYLLNAKPGRYAAVACLVREVVPMTPSKERTTFFSKEVIKLTEVEVPPGTIKFMGQYVVNQVVSFEEADDAQINYFQLIAPGAKTGVSGALLSPGKYYHPGSLHEKKFDKEAEITFLNNALLHLKDTGWVNIIQKRLEELKAGK
jgi:hypothetical protein